jgi:hypothetical protein
MLDLLEHESEEIVVIRNNPPVAKLVPGAPRLTALEALADLYRTLPGKEGTAWLKDSRRVNRGRRRQVRVRGGNPGHLYLGRRGARSACSG